MGWFRLPFLMTKQSLFLRYILLYGFAASKPQVTISRCEKAFENHALQETRTPNLPSTRPRSRLPFGRNKRHNSFGNFFFENKSDGFPFSTKFSSYKPLTSYSNQETTEEDTVTDNRAPKLMKYSRCQNRQICNFYFHETGILIFSHSVFWCCSETWKELVWVRNNVNQPKKTTGKAREKQNTDFQYLTFSFFMFSFFVFMRLPTSSELNMG